jgi:hypothetical protein
MRRIQALLLLFVLLTGTTSALAKWGIDPASDCCASGICPLHHGQNLCGTSVGKSIAPGTHNSRSACEADCRGGEHANRVVANSSVEAVLHDTKKLPTLRVLDTFIASLVLSNFTGFDISPEQPPRN